MAKAGILVFLLLSCVVVSVEPYGGRGFNLLRKLVKGELKGNVVSKNRTEEYLSSPVYVGLHDGLKEADKIQSLPGQPDGYFNQYSGYVTVDPQEGRALFYYFSESPYGPSDKPLVLWLSGGPGCSSFGNGAMMELGPFRVNSDAETLSYNEYTWNNVANIIFLESPVGVGFSYSNTTSDHEAHNDMRTAEDSYTFLINWLERFPEYKVRDFFIAGEGYGGNYAPHLAQLILQKNEQYELTNQTFINLRGIAIGNVLFDEEAQSLMREEVHFLWRHFLISDEMRDGFDLNCVLYYNESECEMYYVQLDSLLKHINPHDVYAPVCNSFTEGSLTATFDPCSENYVTSYLNDPRVQYALHASDYSHPHPWKSCSDEIWQDYVSIGVLPVIQDLMTSEPYISIWLYSGVSDPESPTTATKHAIEKLNTTVTTPWYLWYTNREVGGSAVEYENLTFVTVRGAGQMVPSYQPARALTLFSSFLDGKLPPASS